jgi:hypothetical protein
MGISSLFVSLNAQKKTIYYDENYNIIQKDKFHSIDVDNLIFFKFIIENDTSIYYFLDKREELGFISNTQFDELWRLIASTPIDQTDSLKTIVINYYQGPDDCNKTANWDYYNSTLNKYSKKLKKRKDVTQLFICKTLEGTDRYSNKITWLVDKEDILGKHFFLYPYPCSSFMIIYPNKEFYVFKGEHMLDQIFDKLIFYYPEFTLNSLIFLHELKFIRTL